MSDRKPDADYDALVAAATGGDEPAFARLAERHRRELHVHCYRMLGSFEEAEDGVQETFLRAWRSRRTYAGRSTYRAWLYRIATNACLDAIRRDERAVPRVSASQWRLPPFSEFSWLQPYPDSLLDQVAGAGDDPEAVVVARETIELAFLAAIQLLPPTQRAVLILRDVLDFSAAQTASLLDATVPSVNSALQRARATMQRYRRSGSPTPAASPEERALVQRYIDAHDHLDPEPVIALLREDARLTISPMGRSWEGRDEIAADYREGLGALGDFRSVATSANRQPAVAHYLRRWGDTEYRAFSIVVLGFEGGWLVDYTTFTSPGLFAAFGLPPTR